MIFNETRLSVLDNSGALIVKCFRVFGKSYGSIGTKLVVSVQTFRGGKKVKKGEIFKAVVVHVKSPHRRATGNYIKFENNGVILWKRKEESPVGTRIRFNVPIELRFMGYLKVVLLSAGTF
jgi:large subunit ribosomal protein L14